MTERKLDLKSPWVAGVLAFLVPGAGHFYQRRNFKAALYLVCILGTFLYGMALGEWRAVYWTENPGQDHFGRPAKKNLGFLAQAGVGTPAMVAYLQSRRYHTPANQPATQHLREFDEKPGDQRDPEFHGGELRGTLPTIDAVFTGVVIYDDKNRPSESVSGRLHLEPWNRTYQGTLETSNGKLQLGHSLLVDSLVLGDPERIVWAGVVDGGRQVGKVKGTIPRGLTNWMFAPLDDHALQDLNGRLHKRFEMALVYTWIAGLLNILAIWDAVQGPAYGFGDEPPPSTESTDTVDPEKAGKKEASLDACEPAHPSRAGSPSASASKSADAVAADSAPALAEAAVDGSAASHPSREAAGSTAGKTPGEKR